MTAGQDTAFWMGAPRCPSISEQLCQLVMTLPGEGPSVFSSLRCLRTAKRRFSPSSIFPLLKILTSVIVDLKPLFSWWHQQSAILGISALVWWLCCHPIACWSSLRLFLVLVQRQNDVLRIQPMQQAALYLGNQMWLLIESDKNFTICLGYTDVNLRFILSVEGHRA